MKNNVKISEVKKVYTVFSDEETRGFCASLRRLKKDCEDASAAKAAEAAESSVKVCEDALKAAKKRAEDMQRAAKKDAAKKDAAIDAGSAAVEAAEALAVAKKAAQQAKLRSAEVTKRSAENPKAAKALASLAEVMLQKEFSAEDITKDFLLQYLPQKFNAAGSICKVSAVKPEEEEETRAKFVDTPEALQVVEDTLYIYKPLLLFTANTFLSFFCSAAEARKKENKEVLSAAEKEEKKRAAEERERKRYEAYKAKIAAYEAKQAKKAEAQK